MKLLDNVLFLAANTSRSKAYSHAMYVSGFQISNVLILEKLNDKKKSYKLLPSSPFSEIDGIHYPDLNKSLESHCKKITKNITRLKCNGVNHSSVLEYFQVKKPKLVIYSGFGGEIVPEKLLSLNIPFLHIHSGLLPEYRGSTTIYYSILKDFMCGVSAILLDTEIDKGPIIASRSYPPPPPNIDIDYLYDNAIRANLLTDVLNDWLVELNFNNLFSQKNGDISPYYVIHPVLKHLALLGLENGSIHERFDELYSK